MSRIYGICQVCVCACVSCSIGICGMVLPGKWAQVYQKKYNVSRKIDFFKSEFGLKLINSDHSFLTDNLWDPLCIIG